MKALVYHGPGQKAWEEAPDPKIVDPTDAIVQVDTTTICGTDLHILKGDVPAVTEGRILGHEGVGTVVEVDSSVRNITVGDRVIISCISSCGVCIYCRSGNPSHCLAEAPRVVVFTSPMLMLMFLIHSSCGSSWTALPCTPTLATLPPGRTSWTHMSKVTGMPTASTATSTP